MKATTKIFSKSEIEWRQLLASYSVTCKKAPPAIESMEKLYPQVKEEDKRYVKEQIECMKVHHNNHIQQKGWIAAQIRKEPFYAKFHSAII